MSEPVELVVPPPQPPEPPVLSEVEGFEPSDIDIAPISRMVNDITIQSHRLARLIDRLPEGEFQLVIVKRSRFEAWQARLMQDQQVLRVIDLFR